MRKKQLMFGAAAALLGIAAVLGGCSKKEDSGNTIASVEAGYWEAQEKDSIKGLEFTPVGESENMQLLLNPKTATLRWLDTATGVYQDTNLSANEDLQKITDAEKSDVVVSFFNGKHSETYKTYASYDASSMSVSLDQVSYQLMDNGVRVIYTLGDNAMTYKNFPLDITNERMEELVLQYLDDKQKETISKSYYTQMSDGSWHRKSNKNSPLAGLAVDQLYNLFYEVGHYTEEELLADLEAGEVDAEEYPSNLSIVVPIEYYLDGDELVVNVDASKLETGPDNPIRNLTLLPYFLTSDPAQEAEEGYMFVPDGSGALIYLDSTKTTEYHFSGSWYGGDRLIGATTYSSANTKMQMPIFGMKNSESTILGVIENGSEVASLDAYVSGTDNSEPFCKMRLTFDIRPQQAITSDSKNAYMVYKASDDVYDENITIRYYWLGEDADYVDMAACYRSYLEEKGDLAAIEPEEKAPFYVEVLGTTDKTKYMLGIPYGGKEVVTSFKDAQALLKDLNDRGITNVKLIYSGMVNGGMNQRALTKGVSFADGLGGGSAFKSLASYAESVGAELYPNLLLETAYTKKNINDSQAAWNIVNARAQIYEFSPVTMKVEESPDYVRYLINPNYMGTYLEKVKSSYQKKTGLDTMASSDLMSFIGTTYKGTQVSLSTGEALYHEAASSLAQDMKLMLSNPMADAYKYSSSLTDIPTVDSGNRVLDAAIPFMQLVLDGHKTYSSESLNQETTDIKASFMHAIETRSVPKFTFTYRDSSLLAKTEQADLFAVDYSYWKDDIANWYQEYETFYEAVKGAQIESHEIYERQEDLRVVTYTNGVKVYFNYSSLDETVDGVDVPAYSYIIEEG